MPDFREEINVWLLVGGAAKGIEPKSQPVLTIMVLAIIPALLSFESLRHAIETSQIVFQS